jgi:hypothetical protein
MVQLPPGRLGWNVAGKARGGGGDGLEDQRVGDEVSDLTSEACVPADDLAIADDGRAKSLAGEVADEVVYE